MDVGMMMVFASYRWENINDDQVWDEGVAVGAAGRRGVRRPVVGRTSLFRLFVLPGQLQ